MEALSLFLDTHDCQRGSFPEGLTETQFADFFPQYEAACRAEGVVLLQIQAGLAEGRAFCLTLSPSRDAVMRAHQKVGLRFDSITEVQTATPGAFFFRPAFA